MAIKVTGPQGGAPPPEPEAPRGTDPAKGAGSVDKAGSAPAGRSFAETLAAGRAAATPGSPAVGAPDALTADIAADLKAGRVDAHGALERVVERVLDRQLGADASPALRAQLRDALRDTISGDPFLADRLRGLS